MNHRPDYQFHRTNSARECCDDRQVTPTGSEVAANVSAGTTALDLSAKNLSDG
ncbi:hypothetical protein HSR121_1325 [Halapricum desulfuricans]|uniref:Uncharacterized protein n=1 Tax=Halapricum desulfuricans TaxID=2841257 RepID=A0A897MU50_9EURY|nr:hypothetical protein HSR121_1325 [Halapricum desulfuricans]